jgi:GNAT superfamily N-acetyltransferase
MPDLLVRLYDLPSSITVLEQLAGSGVEVRRALASEKAVVTRWVADQFTNAWSGECEIAFNRQPIACIVALRENTLLGFSCHGVICPDFLGPIGVIPEWRKQNVGKALLLASLEALRAEGYAYAIIGWAGPTAFFQKSVNAMLIAGSEPGIYRGMLKERPHE